MTPDPDIVKQLEPLLPELLDAAHRSQETVITRPLFDRLSVPKHDVQPPPSRCASLIEEYRTHPVLVLCRALLGADELRNVLVYAAGNPLHWHTNSNAPGERVYYVYNEVAGSVFRYLEGGEVITVEEEQGWTARQFTIGDETDLFWHCAWAAGRRVSFGFKV